jgi:hypothetical protein
MSELRLPLAQVFSARFADAQALMKDAFITQCAKSSRPPARTLDSDVCSPSLGTSVSAVRSSWLQPLAQSAMDALPAKRQSNEEGNMCHATLTDNGLGLEVLVSAEVSNSLIWQAELPGR